MRPRHRSAAPARPASPELRGNPRASSPSRRSSLSVTKLMEAETAALPGPSDLEAKDFYEKNPERFKQDESVRASHILIRVDPKADAATKKKARAEIDAVLKQAKAGADFAKLAQQHSQDGSAAQGGD